MFDIRKNAIKVLGLESKYYELCARILKGTDPDRIKEFLTKAACLKQAESFLKN